MAGGLNLSPFFGSTDRWMRTPLEATYNRAVPTRPSDLMTALNTDYDSPWKSFIELYFHDFLSFFFPQIEADVDWTKPIRFLDKELQKVVRDAEIPKRYADKLVEVHRLSGEKAIVICHIEVQNESEADFAARMYSYNYRLRDRYNCPVVSLAILTDDSRQWRPNGFQDELFNLTLGLFDRLSVPNDQATGLQTQLG